MFSQSTHLWVNHINFVYPAEPTIGRVLTFLPHTRARTVVVFPLHLAVGRWWSSWTTRGQNGVLATAVHDGFLIVAVDHSVTDDALHL